MRPCLPGLPLPTPMGISSSETPLVPGTPAPQRRGGPMLEGRRAAGLWLTALSLGQEPESDVPLGPGQRAWPGPAWGVPGSEAAGAWVAVLLTTGTEEKQGPGQRGLIGSLYGSGAHRHCPPCQGPRLGRLLSCSSLVVFTVSCSCHVSQTEL